MTGQTTTTRPRPASRATKTAEKATLKAAPKAKA
jgi:hypothetical protein